MVKVVERDKDGQIVRILEQAIYGENRRPSAPTATGREALVPPPTAQVIGARPAQIAKYYSGQAKTSVRPVTSATVTAPSTGAI